MKTNTNSQLHALLSKAGLMKQKESLVYSYTDKRTTTSTEMSEAEAISLIKHLKGLVKKVEPPPKQPDQRKDATRKYILSLWYRIENANTQTEKEEARQKCFAWVQTHFKGHLNGFEMVDLFRIKLAAEKVLKDRAKAVRKEVLSCE